MRYNNKQSEQGRRAMGICERESSGHVSNGACQNAYEFGYLREQCKLIMSSYMLSRMKLLAHSNGIALCNNLLSAFYSLPYLLRDFIAM